MEKYTFGNWLKHHRIASGLTQVELEEAASLSEKYVSGAERGRVKLPDEKTRRRIHAVLGTSDEDLAEAGILVRFQPRPGVTIYRPVDEAIRTIPKLPPSSADDLPPHMRASFLKAGDLSPEKQRLLGQLIDQFYEDDQDYIDQMRRDRERRETEGIKG